MILLLEREPNGLTTHFAGVLLMLEFTDADFSKEVLQSDKPVLVDFSAVWCGPCKQLGPIIEELAKEYEGRVKVGKVDIDESQDLPRTSTSRR
jgi:thioredoxin